ncbi:hypothetical protein Anas_03319, partial [Armadillidium nasatum]
SLAAECTRRYYGFSSFVCVCDGTYCNFDGENDPTIDATNVKVVKSSRDEFRNSVEVLPRQDGTINSSDVNFSIFVNANDRRQDVIGFGGAFTDSASINIKSLTAEAQNNLMNMYFAKEGSRYNLVRVPIAGTDFSTHPYSYDDIEGDVDLVYFDLSEEDYNYKNWAFNTCGWTAEDMRDWIATVLGPTVSEAGYRRLKLLIDDFNRDTLPSYVIPIVEDATAVEYVDGVAVHWYNDLYFSPDVLDQTHDIAVGKFILYTEACIDPVSGFVELGNWERGEQYITDIIEDSNHWSTGWIDWNLALDLQGGPNWVSNFVDSPMIVNATANEFYVQPLYYALSHFSRNVQRGATWVSSSIDQSTNDLKVTAFENPNGQIVVIIANVAETAYDIGILNENQQYIFKYNIAGKTWLSITYQR